MAGSEDDIPPPPPPSQTPTQQTPHTVSTIKLAILKKGEYDIWAMKMEYYLAHTDYHIWKVIQRGNGPVSVSTDTNGLIKVLPPRPIIPQRAFKNKGLLIVGTFVQAMTWNKQVPIKDKREISNARTQQQNRVVIRKNRTYEDYFVLPIWSSYTSTVKSSKAKMLGEEPTKARLLNSRFRKFRFLSISLWEEWQLVTKWVYRIRRDERGVVPLLLNRDSLSLRMDVKSAPSLVKALYGLHQAPRACLVVLGSGLTPKNFQSKSHLSVVKRIFRYLKGKPKLGLWYPRVSSFDLEAYSDSDYAGANLDRKSTTGGCQFLGRRLISWQCKKQTIVATSTTEAEYVAAANCCGQVLWIQNQMLDYGFNFMNTKIYIDNESTICIVKNLVFHSKTKHIAIRHHFIRDAYEKKLIQVLKIHTDDNVADLLTKAFDVSSYLGFRESLERDIDGTEELLLPDLFILWLTKVSTDSAKLIPLGKDSTAIKTLEKIPPRV
ncbi:hypothetical protein Tco_1538006 [Tanacetum coccineum]